MKLNGKILLKGLGLHSGKECELLIEPYDCEEILMRSGDKELPLSKFALNGTNRGSDYIFPDGSKIKTCEHVLSALTGMGIWSGARITVKGGEMPALDGCGKILSEEIKKHSVDPLAISWPSPHCQGAQESETEGLMINNSVIVSTEDKKRFVAAFPSDRLHVTYTVEYDFIGTQIFDYEHSPENYYENIASARTFAMESEINYLRSHGMALGGSLDNAIAVGEKIQAKGGLRWPDEFVRHKVLDLIGDLASIGRPLNAHIIACRAGHELHLKLAEKLRQNLKGE